jgi:alpha-glucosidase
VSDYVEVHPEVGTLADLDALVAEAGSRGIRVLLDLVPNHTSDEHEWFLEARSARDSPRRDWYVWADPGPDGTPPTEGESVFGGSTWTFDEHSGQFYAHRFDRKQPDLNWRNPAVADAFDEILRFWFSRGIAGFRIDVAHEIVKHPVKGVDLERTHEVLRRWRGIADEFDPPRVLVGETWVMELEQLVTFYGSGTDELDLAFNFPFVFAAFDAGALRAVAERTLALLPPSAWPAWTASNHDNIRFPTRWCGGDEAKIRCALLILLALQGTSFLYYGDEIGMENVAVPPERVLDVDDRDGERTPMRWSGEEGAGFTTRGVEPWLPLGDRLAGNVADQQRAPTSVLHFARELIALRRDRQELFDGAYGAVEAPLGVWAWRRGERILVAVNLSPDHSTLAAEGQVLIGTDRARDGTRVSNGLELGPWEGVVLESG